MTTRDRAWPAGTPCWVDLIVGDTAAARRFYSELFGWDCQDGPKAAFGYTMCLLKGRPVAGIGPRPEGGGMPSVWSTYLASDQADSTTDKIRDSGGTVMMRPFNVLDVGRMAYCFDVAGAAFGVWEARSHTGARIVNEPGALTWNECMSRDFGAAKAFYTSVFGYGYDDVGDGSDFRYSVIKVADAPVGGMGELGDDVPADLPSHWMVYFGTADTDGAVARGRSLGANVQVPPVDTPYGRMSVLQGPQGEVFSLITV